MPEPQIPHVRYGPTDIRNAQPFLNWRDAHAWRSLPGALADQMIGRGRMAGSSRGEIWALGPGVITAVRPPDGQPGALTVVSTDVADDFGSTGAETLLVQYLDADGYYRIGLAVLDGLTPVAVLEAEYLDGVPVFQNPPTQAVGLRINRMLVIRSNAGANDVANVGTITGRIFVGATDEPQTAIGPGHGINLHAAFTIPRGFFGVLFSFGVSTDVNAQGESYLIAKQLGLPPITFLAIDVSRSSLVEEFPAARRAAPLSDLRIEAERLNATEADFTGTVTFCLVPDKSDPDPNGQLQPLPLG